MSLATLYNIHVKSADPTQSTDGFIADQKKITAAVKRTIRHDLSREFSYADRRVPGIARSFQAYATPAALAVLTRVASVEKIERMTSSVHPLTRDL